MSAFSIVNDLASEAHGVALVDAVRSAGVSARELRHLSATGRVHTITPRVLRAPGAPRTQLQEVLIAVLDAAPGAFACSTTAAALWGVSSYELRPVHVMRARGISGRRSSLAVLHEVKGLLPWHVTTVQGIPTVRPERMVLDLCAGQHPRRAALALDDAWRRRLLSGRSLRCLLEDASVQGRPGLRVLRELLDARGADYVPPASNLESRFAAVIARAGLPEMRRQVDAGGDDWVGRVDFRDAHVPLVVEVQSETYHSALTDVEADQRRLAALRAAGFAVVEVTDADVWHRPHDVVRRVRDARARL